MLACFLFPLTMLFYHITRKFHLMYRILSLTLLCFIAIVSFTACSKKENDTVSSDKSKLNSLFAAFRSAPQQLTVTAGTYQTVKGAKGTKLTFYPHSFKDENGNTITSGTINLQLVEMYKPGDMIANRATTQYKDGLLESGGQIYLTASQNGKQVYAGKYGIGYGNATSKPGMALFPGNTNNEDSLVTWTDPLASVGSFCVTGTFDTTMMGLIYKFDSCTKFGWINCDRFYSDTAAKTKVFLTTGDKKLDASNTQVFIILPSINSVTAMRSYDAGSRRFELGGIYMLPEGLIAHFIVMANKDGTYYYYEKLNQTITTNIEVDAKDITVRSIDYIKERLFAL